MRENKRDDIFKCALKLFSEKGYDAVSPNEIVEKVGITKPTLYYFFGSKEGLFEEILKTSFTKLDTLLNQECKYTANPANYDQDIYPALVNVVATYFAFAKENSDFYLMVLSMWFLPPSSKSALLSEKYQTNQFYIVQRMFTEISAAHHNLKGKESIYTWRFLTLINAQIGFWHRGFGAIDIQSAQSIVTTFMHGILS